MAAARQAGQRELLTEALAMAANAENMAGDRAAARRLLEEAEAPRPAGLDVSVRAGSPSCKAKSLDGFFAADPGAVAAAAGPGAPVWPGRWVTYTCLEMMLLNLGSAALLAGELDESRPLLAEALEIAGLIDDRVAQFYLLGAFGCHAARSRPAAARGATDRGRRHRADRGGRQRHAVHRPRR